MRAFFKKSNSQVDGDLNNQNLTSTGYGINQSYITGATRLNLDYQHLIDEDESSFNTSLPRETKDTEDTLELTMATKLGNHDLSSSSKFNFVKRSDQFLSDDQILQIFRHNYRPGNNLTVNNLFTYSNRDIEQLTGATSDLNLVQFNSNVFWRPKTEKKLLITATTLMQGSGELTNNEIGIFDNVGVSGQASYQWNPFLNLRAQTSVNHSDIRTQSQQRIGAEYTPADSDLFGFRHAYNLSADGTNFTDTLDQARQELNLRAGHIFSRNYPTKIGNVKISLTQRAATIVDSISKVDRTLSHTIGSSWNKSTNKSTNLARITISDTRRFSNESNEFGLQQANLQVNSNYLVGRDSSINGNVTFQANRTLDDATDNSVDLNSSVSLNYNHNRLFGVRNLRFTSEIRYISNTLFEIINSDGFDDTNRNNVFWQNRFYYDIGQLSLRLTTNLGQSNGEFNNFFLFQIRRNFGN